MMVSGSHGVHHRSESARLDVPSVVGGGVSRNTLQHARR